MMERKAVFLIPTYIQISTNIFTLSHSVYFRVMRGLLFDMCERAENSPFLGRQGVATENWQNLLKLTGFAMFIFLAQIGKNVNSTENDVIFGHPYLWNFIQNFMLYDKYIVK